MARFSLVRKAFPVRGEGMQPSPTRTLTMRGTGFLTGSPALFVHTVGDINSWRRLCGSALGGRSGVFPTKTGTNSRRRLAVSAVLRPRIAVVGGGFGGLNTALKLAKLPWTRLTRPEITLIDRSERFSFLPMMYELATGEAEAWEVAPRFDMLLKDYPISFIQASAESITFGDSLTLHVRPCGPVSSGPMEINFDRAVLALGCQPASRDSIPGATQHALTLYSHDDALAIRERLSDIQKARPPSRSVNIVVVGGGFSGIETASCIAEKLGSAGSVVIVDRGDRLLASGEDFNRLAAERVLLDRGVSVQYRKSVSRVAADSITLVHAPALETSSDNGGETSESITLPADLVIWTAGAAPSPAIAALGVPLSKTGRVDTDELLQVRGHEDRLFALGDVATLPTSDANGGYSGTAQVAMQQADYAAWNVWASLTGRRKLQYRYVQLGEMLVLGSRDGSVATKLGVEVDGAAGWAMRRAVYAARMPTDRHRARVAASWAVAPVVGGVVSSLSNCVGGDAV